MQTATTYDQAFARRYPEQVAIAIAKDAQGKYNPITLGWVTLTSREPPMIAISVGLTRYSLQAVRRSREFVLSLPSSKMTAETLLFGTKSGRDMDKLAEAGITTQPATAVDGLLLADAVANFECKVVSEVQTGDHVLFIGQVVAAHVNGDASLGRLYALGHERLGGVAPA
jgi:flavin reductase (DIM6/NTAB) family NADH-FMN oxidoreductase RutF